jgi:hypothetical protein
MLLPPRVVVLVCLLIPWSSVVSTIRAQDQAAQREIPEPLQAWADWATWDVKQAQCPRLYNRSDTPVCYWPGRLELSVDQTGGRWAVDVLVFETSWVPIPGDATWWPLNVRVEELPAVVVPRQNLPATKLKPGKHRITGEFVWDQMPQQLSIPPTIGLLDLNVEGNDIATPKWGNDGVVWLKRQQSDQADKDLLTVNVYRVIEDGIPVWLRSQIELTVSGKSREEALGWSLPEGWQISSVSSPIPVAMDDRGLLKAQVRSGKWIVSVDAFQASDPGTIQYAVDADPIADTELIGLRPAPEFRVSQLEGLEMVDTSQTTFPEAWRDVAVHRWNTAQPFTLVQKMRGMGSQKPKGLQIDRRLWLDDDGDALTFRDQIRGEMQQIWRLDVVPTHELGAVRTDGVGQLITVNPETGASGVELRSRDLNVTAIGRVDRSRQYSAAGWDADADSLRWTLTLPPGWRVFAVFGADQVIGDWLTAWSLLDLFLLLVFTFAVLRLFGWLAALIALVAFGLSYHELGAPHFTWLFVLMPIGLLRVVEHAGGRKWLQLWKFVALGLLLLALIPFIAMQTQSAIYPQLESAGSVYGQRPLFGWPVATYSNLTAVFDTSRSQSEGKMQVSSRFLTSNLKYDPRSQIQTGPAEPLWGWNNVTCVWNGPVQRDQTIRPILISRTQNRVLTVARVILLVLLAAVILAKGKIRLRLPRRSLPAAMILGCLLLPSTTMGQLPDRETLDLLRQRLTETPDVYPNAAEIPRVDLQLRGNVIEFETEIHAAIETAVPLPGHLPDWSPLTVSMDGDQEMIVARRDGYLWALVPAGVHKVSVKGLLAEESDWEWTFALKPRYMAVDANGWKVSGINPNGVPDSQVFFTREQATSDDLAAYDRREFNAIVAIDRYLEIGLVSKLRTTVTRLSNRGKAVSLSVPLLAGESVLTGNMEVENGEISVRMGANQDSMQWESELVFDAEILLQAADSQRWVERWHLITSPIWNVNYRGLNPIFEGSEKDLIPVWHPWPGERVALSFSRPEAIRGETMTLQRVEHVLSLGGRLRNASLVIDVECSLATDLVVDIGPDAEVRSLTRNGQSIPVQRDQTRLIVPTVPGKQTIDIDWERAQPLGVRAEFPAVTVPVEASNVTSVLVAPDNRWVLWADGPLRGPAVRFWTILAVAVLGAIVLGSLPISPLRRYEWALLGIGLTQVHLVPALIVVGWVFMLAYRGRIGKDQLGRMSFNLLQLILVVMTAAALVILVIAVGAGLLGHPEMFIVGNGSTRTHLQWFQPRIDQQLPIPFIVSVSVWCYRLLMLCWALWLASALLRWLAWGWKQFTSGEVWRKKILRAKPVLEQ